MAKSKRSGDRLIKGLLVLLILSMGLLAGLVIAYFATAGKSGSDGSSAETAGSTSSYADISAEPAYAEMSTDETTADKNDKNENTDKKDDSESASQTTDSSGHDGDDDNDIDKMISEMSLREKICQLIICTPEELTGYSCVTAAGDTTKTSLEKYPVGGLIYFAQNLEDVSQTEEMIGNTKNYAAKITDIPMFFSVDEEGGIVARCADKLNTPSFSPMYEYKDEGEETAYDNAYTIAKSISELGFNLDFAPVADTWSNKNNTVIGTRAYSDDFEQTAKLVASAVKGFNDGGVCCSLKHFPGHGDTAEDTHYGSAYSDKTADELAKEEYLAFESGIAAGADMVMVGHITMSNIDGLPASISPEIITGELRGKLGYDGVVITDSLRMSAMADNYTSAELAVKVIQAGGDIILMPGDIAEAVKALEDAVKNGDITEERINESLKRILTLKFEKLS